ncbi:MAG: PDZ domain-containing protein [Pseudobacteriovorax sp.]|nr:PDZ domain-containing protein [Pseudobacteriovorax sp.]
MACFKLIGLFISLNLSSCTTVSDRNQFGFKYTVKYFIDEPVITLIEEFGAPDHKVRLEGSGEIFQYDNPYNLSYSQTNNYYQGGVLVHSSEPIFSKCQLFFGVSENIVKNVKWKGNNCIGRAPKFVELGVSIQESNGQLLISDVIWPSPAAKSGFQIGDRILSVDDQAVHSVYEFKSALVESDLEKPVVSVDRNEVTIKLSADLNRDRFNILGYLF